MVDLDPPPIAMAGPVLEFPDMRVGGHPLGGVLLLVLVTSVTLGEVCRTLRRARAVTTAAGADTAASSDRRRRVWREPSDLEPTAQIPVAPPHPLTGGPRRQG